MCRSQALGGRRCGHSDRDQNRSDARAQHALRASISDPAHPTDRTILDVDENAPTLGQSRAAVKISHRLLAELRGRLPELAFQESRHDTVSRAIYSAEAALNAGHESGDQGDIVAAALELGRREFAFQVSQKRIDAYAARFGYQSAVQMRRTASAAEAARVGR